jgi:hypothetical protein
MTIDVGDYLASVESHEREWGLLDQTLYRLCDEFPHHTERGAVNAKLWLIGRSFASGVERHIKSSGTQGSSLGKMAEHLMAHHEQIDPLVQQLRKFVEPLDPDKLSEIVAIHGEFCKLASRIAHRGRVLASFASKYLHFHAAIVPMYDRFAYAQAWRMRRKDGLESFPFPKGGNVDYYWYSLCFWQLYSGLRDTASPVSVRLAESYLLWLASS